MTTTLDPTMLSSWKLRRLEATTYRLNPHENYLDRANGYSALIHRDDCLAGSRDGTTIGERHGGDWPVLNACVVEAIWTSMCEIERNLGRFPEGRIGFCEHCMVDRID